MARVTVAEPAVSIDSTDIDDVIDDVAVLERAWHGRHAPAIAAPAPVADTQLSIIRTAADDVQDRQIYLWVDGEEWGKIRYGHTLTRPVAPGRHTVRAFNTLLSRTIEVDVGVGGHARVRCANGFPLAGWLMMMFLHVTYLHVRLEADLTASGAGRS